MNSNGHEYVDLGLPSGIKWATCNVGADKPEDYGLLFQFARTDGYKYGDKNHKFSSLKENNLGQKLNLAYDIAHVNMGGDWVMPTRTDLQELYENTTRKVVTINGNRCMLFTSKVNGKSIFVVFAGNWYDGEFYDDGYYGNLWSSECDSHNSNCAWQLSCDSRGECYIYCYDICNYGFSVRGVLK